MKTLKLSEAKALELYKTGSSELKQILEESFGKEFFKPKLIADIVFDIETLCEYLGIDDGDLFIFNKRTKDKHERYMNACNILPKIAQVYNEGAILDWKKTSEYKYLPYLYFSGGSAAVSFGSWNSSLVCPAGLCYKTNDLSKAAYKNFQIYFEDYWQLKAD